MHSIFPHYFFCISLQSDFKLLSARGWPILSAKSCKTVLKDYQKIATQGEYVPEQQWAGLDIIAKNFHNTQSSIRTKLRN